MANTAGIYIKTSSGLTPAATVPGPPGIQGATGTQGLTGATGSVWYTGAGAPVTGTGVVNDFYLDTSAGDVYKKTATSTWTLQGNIKGNPGDLTSAVVANTGASFSLTAAMIPSTRVYTLGQNTTMNALPTPSSSISGTISMVFKQPATGGPYSLAFPVVEWPNDAAAPSMPTAANSELIVHFFWTGQAWRAVVGGIFYP